MFGLWDLPVSSVGPTGGTLCLVGRWDPHVRLVEYHILDGHVGPTC
jgi:hypothetical protein